MRLEEDVKCSGSMFEYVVYLILVLSRWIECPANFVEDRGGVAVTKASGPTLEDL